VVSTDIKPTRCVRMAGVGSQPPRRTPTPPAAVDVTMLGRFYERFADHAVEIGRRIIFQATGRTSRVDVSYPRGRERRQGGADADTVSAWPSAASGPHHRPRHSLLVRVAHRLAMSLRRCHPRPAAGRRVQPLRRASPGALSVPAPSILLGRRADACGYVRCQNKPPKRPPPWPPSRNGMLP
jgi:hypothetical protein